MIQRRRFLVAATAAAASASAGPMAWAQDDRPQIAAAADLRFALDAIAGLFAAAGGPRLAITYGSSGNFTRQIEQGAPYDMFLSADEALVERLDRAGLTRDRSALYAIGRIALLLPREGRLLPDATLADLTAASADGRLRRLSIANPEHAPYGRAAQQILERIGLWPKLQTKIVLGENVAQAAQFVLSGATEAGLVALSLARAPDLAAKSRFAVIAADRHDPLRQRMVLLKRARPSAEKFYDYMGGQQARGTLAQFGFEQP